ncbi:MAG: hypothetical protein E7261_09540 [Lachnospiraceae bacterium]|nr:hypothetical protein [Lachnospiraceae bacterium]
MKRYLYFLFVAITILVFLLNSKLTLEGSANGLVLWLNTVVPTLLPFMILSSVLIGLQGEQLLNKLFSPITSKLFGLSPSGNYVFIIGMFCGYPLGAKTAADLLQEKRLSLKEAQYLMNFCNNISPIFTVSFICNTLLNNKKIIPFAILILYGIPIFMAFFTKKYYIQKNNFLKPVTKTLKSACQKEDIITLLDNAIVNSALTSLKLGGYIILFSVFCSLFEHMHILPETLRTIAVICLEVTTGCRYCTTSPLLIQSGLIYPTLFTCATFGGLSGIAQTSGMINGSGLSLKQYILFRIACSAIVFIISYLIFIIL